MKLKISAAVFLFAIALLLLSSCAQEDAWIDGLQVNFIDVGQADSALVRCGGAAMLIDGGNREDSDLLYTFLKDNGVKSLDYLVCSHPHEDHAGGLAAAFEACDVDTVIAPVDGYDSDVYRDFAASAEECGGIVVPSPGDVFTLGQAEFEILGPVQDYDEANNMSIVLKITYGETSFLFTGDAESQSEHDIIDSGAELDATVLKVGHHGSGTSSSYVFLRETDPEYAVISVGEDNSYGHPSDDVLSRLRDVGAVVYRTDMQGTVTAFSDGNSVTFTTEKGSNAVTNPTENLEPEYFIGNKKTLKLHLPTCSGLPDEKNRVYFDTYEEAAAMGYSPCGNCM